MFEGELDHSQEDAVRFKSEQRGTFNAHKEITIPKTFESTPIHSRTSRPNSENSVYGALTCNDSDDEHEAVVLTFSVELPIVP